MFGFRDPSQDKLPLTVGQTAASSLPGSPACLLQSRAQPPPRPLLPCLLAAMGAEWPLLLPQERSRGVMDILVLRPSACLLGDQRDCPHLLAGWVGREKERGKVCPYGAVCMIGFPHGAQWLQVWDRVCEQTMVGLMGRDPRPRATVGPTLENAQSHKHPGPGEWWLPAAIPCMALYPHRLQDGRRGLGQTGTV